MDFTSALYLGLKHPSNDLLAYHQLTTGKPALLAEASTERHVAKKLANLQGLPNGVLGTSTLHLFWDFFDLFSNSNTVIFRDSQLYPIAGWGIDRAKCKGMPVYDFPHLEADGLKATLQRKLRPRQRPIVVTDGWCTQCGKAAPLPKYLQLIRPKGGLLIIDDTQSLGIFGKMSSSTFPYGKGGGGQLPRLNIQGDDIVTISSLAKGFGVPLAVLSGSREWVNLFQRRSKTRLHCSPPSRATIHAAKKALLINEVKGKLLRKQLWDRVQYFRKGLWGIGLKTRGGVFPVQTIANLGSKASRFLYLQLKKAGIQSLLLQPYGLRKTAIAFLLSAQHTYEELNKVLQRVAQAVKSLRLVPK